MSELDLDIDERLSSQYIDLLSERLGSNYQTSDEWFAQPRICSNRDVAYTKTLLRIIWKVDGRLGVSSKLRKKIRTKWRGVFRWTNTHGSPRYHSGFDIDTNHFVATPRTMSLLMPLCRMNLISKPDGSVLPKVPVKPHSQNLFDCNDDRCWTHLRLRIYPDGGVARFRAYGNAMIVKKDFAEGELVDLASAINGGQGIDASDRIFRSPTNLIMPGRGKDMETAGRQSGAVTQITIGR